FLYRSGTWDFLLNAFTTKISLLPVVDAYLEAEISIFSINSIVFLLFSKESFSICRLLILLRYSLYRFVLSSEDLFSRKKRLSYCMPFVLISIPPFISPFLLMKYSPVHSW